MFLACACRKVGQPGAYKVSRAVHRGVCKVGRVGTACGSGGALALLGSCLRGILLLRKRWEYLAPARWVGRAMDQVGEFIQVGSSTYGWPVGRLAISERLDYLAPAR